MDGFGRGTVRGRRQVPWRRVVRWALAAGVLLAVTALMDEPWGAGSAVALAGCGVAPARTLDIVGVAGDTVFVGADDGRHGYELWRADGTSPTASLVKDTISGRDGPAWIHALATVGDALWFVAPGADGTPRLWRSDGTEAGTVPIASIDGSAARFVATVGGVQYFLVDEGAGQALWRSDGTADGTRRVRRLRPSDAGVEVGGAAVAEGSLYFTIDRSSLWRSDGTRDGTVRLAAVPAGDAHRWLTILASVGDTSYYAIQSDSGDQLWRSDGTDEGTFRLDPEPGGRYITDAAVMDDRLFYAFDGRLWRTDGTLAGTAPTDVGLDVDQIAAHDDVLTLWAGGEPWRSDGTAAGTVVASDEAAAWVELMTDTGPLTNPWLLLPGDQFQYDGSVAADDTLYLDADDGVHGYELWRSDGTSEGTTLVRDIRPGPKGAFAPGRVGSLAAIGGRAYFVADDGVHGHELWRSDGTPEGTTLVRDVRAGPASSTAHLTVAGDRLYFVVPDEPCAPNTELWRSDGTAEGTVVVLEVRP